MKKFGVRRTILSATAAALVLAVAPSAQAAPAKVPPIAFTERTLANGLKVIAIRDTKTPDVTVSMWYDVGSKHDPAGRSGFAHLFEHVLSRKTVNMPYNAINRMVDDVGGTRNASTWYDRTNYYETVPAEYLERMLWTHAERMARPVVDKEVFETERNVVKEELRQRVLAPPYGRFYSFALGENLYNIVPQRRPTIGSISDLDSATLDDARAFHQAYYGPDTATLIVAGNFDPAQLNRLVDSYFASIPKRRNAIPLVIREKDAPVAPRTIVATGPNVELPIVASAWQLPGESHPDMPALAILDQILAAGEHSRLNTALVKPGLAASVSSYFNNVEEQSFIAVNAIVAGGKDSALATAALDEVIMSMRRDGPTAAEVEEARNELLVASLAARETASGRLFELGEALVRTGNPRAADKRLADLSKVTPADVKRVAAKYLSPDRQLQFRYVKGDGEASGWANPTPLPKFRTVPAAVGEGNQLASEDKRQAPPAPGVKPAFAIPTVTESRLANGLRLFASRTGDVPLATITVALGAGTATDPRELAGRAQLAAAIATKGTPTRTAEQIATGLERLGASISANAIDDGTFLSVTAPVATLGEAATILADIARNASFPAEDFERDRKRALDGLRIGLKDPGTVAGWLIAPVVYGNSAYGTMAGGTPASVGALTREALLDYRQRWWRPDTAQVIVAGGIDPAVARTIVERSFGDWTATGTAPALPADPAGAALAGRTLVVDIPNAGQAAVFAVARGLSRTDPAYYDAQLANAVLGGSSTSWLYNEIRVKRALSYGSNSGISGPRDEGTVVATAQTKNESAAEVAKIILDQYARIASEAQPEADLAKRRTLLAGRFQRQVQTSAGISGLIAGSVLRGQQPAEALAYADRIAATTGAGATGVMGRLLKPESISLIVVGDAAKFIDALRKVRPNAEVVKADDLDLANAKAK